MLIAKYGRINSLPVRNMHVVVVAAADGGVVGDDVVVAAVVGDGAD